MMVLDVAPARTNVAKVHHYLISTLVQYMFTFFFKTVGGACCPAG